MDADETAKYNAKMEAELEKIQRYRRSVEEEFNTLQGKQTSNEAKAKSLFLDNIEFVADSILNIAMGRHPDASPPTILKAATYIYDRVIITDDDPRKSEMETLLDKLSKDPTPDVPESNNPTNH